MESWTSPDGKIQKKILLQGKFGIKPYETSEVKIKVVDGPKVLEAYSDKTLVIGDSDGDLGRALDLCITTMHKGERAKFDVVLDDENILFVIELVDINFKGFVHEWDANKKFQLSQHHKEKGVQFFKDNDIYEAAFRFTKALKIISTIPIDVEQPPEEIDGVSLERINKLKVSLYNNLSSCYFKKEKYDMVDGLCRKVLKYDENHVKALYKIGVTYEHNRDFENAGKAFSKVMEMEPNNTACAEHLAYVNHQLRLAETRMNKIMKKMFEGI